MTQEQLNEQLLQAIDDFDIEAAKQAIEGGVDVNTKNEYGRTPLCIAKFWGREEIANLLKQHGGV